MQDISKSFYLLGTVFLVLSLVFNISPKLPRFPWDVYINKPGLRLYIPWATSIAISVILTMYFNFFQK